MPDTLPPWRPLLKAARNREGRSPMSRWLQLATIGSDGSPRIRTLVFRGWRGGATLELLTDGRSAKAQELLAMGWSSGPALGEELRRRRAEAINLQP